MRNEVRQETATGTRQSKEEAVNHLAPLAHLLGRTRFVVLLAVIAVTLVSLSLFLLGTVLAVKSVWNTWAGFLNGHLESTDLMVRSLEIVSIMLKAVIFYLIGVGLYSLFIAPLNITVALGVETFNDLETKIISVVVLILAVTFLERFIQWKQPLETLQYGGALALVVAALVFFQMYSHRTKEEQQLHNPETQALAKRELFAKDHEEQEVPAAEGVTGPGRSAEPR